MRVEKYNLLGGISPARSRSAVAVVVVDPQNDFCHVDGVVFKRAEKPQRILDATKWIHSMLTVARRHGVPCFITQSFFDDKYKLPALIKRHRRLGYRQKVCNESTWGARIEAIDIRPSDFIITKHTADAFLYTCLEPLLWKCGVERLLLCGFLTEICVLETGRSAIQRGFEVIVPREGTAGLSGTCSDVALNELAALQATILSGQALLGDWLGHDIDRQLPLPLFAEIVL
jgi:ureidoacrylate peracid hydrolase